MPWRHRWPRSWHRRVTSRDQHIPRELQEQPRGESSTQPCHQPQEMQSTPRPPCHPSGLLPQVMLVISQGHWQQRVASELEQPFVQLLCNEIKPEQRITQGRAAPAAQQALPQHQQTARATRAAHRQSQHCDLAHALPCLCPSLCRFTEPELAGPHRPCPAPRWDKGRSSFPSGQLSPGP